MIFGKREKRVYSRAMRRLEYGYLGYAVSLFRKVTLTTREGDDNTRDKFLRHLKMLVDSFESEGYVIDYCGALLPTPGKGLLHWHGLWRIKGGYFIHRLPDRGREAEKEVRKRWLKYHNAYEIDFEALRREGTFGQYVSKHILKGFVEERARLNFSKGWTRNGVKEAQEVILRFLSDGLGGLYMSSDNWKLYNEMEKAFCCGDFHIWRKGERALVVQESRCEVMSIELFERQLKWSVKAVVAE